MIDNLLVRIHLIIVITRWIGLAPWEFEFPFPGGLTFTFLRLLDKYVRRKDVVCARDAVYLVRSSEGMREKLCDL